MAGTDCVIASAESGEGVLCPPGRRRSLARRRDLQRRRFSRASQTSAPRAELRARLNCPAQALVAGVIARLTDQKGHRYLFDAAREGARAGRPAAAGRRRRPAASGARAAGGRPRSGVARVLSRQPARSRRSAVRDGHLRPAVALGGFAAVAGAGDGRRSACREHQRRRHSRGRAGRQDRCCSCRRAIRRRWPGRSRASSDRPRSASASARRRASTCCRDSASSVTSRRSSRCTNVCWRRDAPHEARHRLPHAVLAGRGRIAVGSRRIVCALRRFARAVLRRSVAVRAGAATLRRPKARASVRPTCGSSTFPTSTARASSIRSCGAARRALRAWVPTVDLLNCRVPTPAGWFAFREARRARVPVFLLVVGDLRARGADAPVSRAQAAPVRSLHRVRGMGARPHDAPGHHLRERRRPRRRSTGAPACRSSRRRPATVNAGDIQTRPDTCQRTPVRILTVSRIDPRKGLRCLPDAVARASRGRPRCRARHRGSRGRRARRGGARGHRGVGAARWALAIASAAPAPIPLDRLLPMYRDYDLFVLPTGPGEGIPRVLLEAMSAGLPVITTALPGIPSLIAHEQNGLLSGRSRPAAPSRPR